MTNTALTLEPSKSSPLFSLPPTAPTARSHTSLASSSSTSMPISPSQWNEGSPLAPTIPLSLAIILPLFLGLIGVLGYAWACRRVSSFPLRVPPFPTLPFLIVVPCIFLFLLGLREALSPSFPCAFSLWSASILLPLWLLSIILLAMRRVLALRYARADQEGRARERLRAKKEWAWAEKEANQRSLPRSPPIREPSHWNDPSSLTPRTTKGPPYSTNSSQASTPPLAPPPTTAIAAAALHRRIEQACLVNPSPPSSSSLPSPPPIPSSTRRNTRLSILGEFADLCSRTFRPSHVSLELPEAASVSRTVSLKKEKSSSPSPSPLPIPSPPMIQLYDWEYKYRHGIRKHGLGCVMGIALVIHLVITSIVQMETTRYRPGRPAQLTEMCRGGWEYAPMLGICFLYLIVALPFLMHLSKPLSRNNWRGRDEEREENPWGEFWGWMGVSFLLTLLAALLSFELWVGPLGLLLLATISYLGTLGMGLALPYLRER